MSDNRMPELRADELSALRASIEQDGVIYPVLLDRAGDIIDGFTRTAIAGELGIECPTHTLLVEPDRAADLRITLNLARRQLTQEQWYALIKTIAVPHFEAIRSEVEQRRKEGSRTGWPARDASEEVGTADHRRSEQELGRRVNADLKAMGITKTITGNTIERIIKKGTGSKPKTKQPKKRSAKDPRTADTNARLLKIRAGDALSQYESMHNAPPVKLNLPMIRRAEQVQHLLVELSSLDPEKAITQIPIERCRQWQVLDAEWWLRFTQLCEARCAAETPDVPLMKYPRRVKLVKGEEEEYQLSPIQASVIAWLRTQTEPKLVLEVANATQGDRSSVQAALVKLIHLRQVRETTGQRLNRMYEATTEGETT